MSFSVVLWLAYIGIPGLNNHLSAQFERSLLSQSSLND